MPVIQKLISLFTSPLPLKALYVLMPVSISAVFLSWKVSQRQTCPLSDPFLYIDFGNNNGKMSTNRKCPLNSGHLDIVDIYLRSYKK